MLATGVTIAKGPDFINYKANLADSLGNPVRDSTYFVHFAIYASETGGSPLWVEDHNVSTQNGTFHVKLGSMNALADSIFADSLRWLGIAIDPDPEMVPRSLIGSVPWAMNAHFAEKVKDKSVGKDQLKDKSVGKDQLDSAAVDTEKIRGKAIGKDQLKDKAVGKDQLDSAAVDTEKIRGKAIGKDQLKDKAVGKDQLDSLAVDTGKLKGNAVTSDKIADGTIAFVDMGQNGALPGQVMKWNGIAWVASDDSIGGDGGITGVYGGDGLTGGGSSGDITLDADFAGSGSAVTVSRSDHEHDAAYVNEGQPNSITSAMIANGEVNHDDVAPNAIDTDNLKDAAVVTAKMDTAAVTSEVIGYQAILFHDIAKNGASAGQVMKWDGTVWKADDDEVGAGDTDWELSGNVLSVGGAWGLGRHNSTLNGTAAKYHVNLGWGSTTGDPTKNDSLVTVGGGYQNTAYGEGGTIGGGARNRTGIIASPDAYYATVGGGTDNQATAKYSVIGGGQENEASGDFSVVVGGGGPGDANRAEGEASFIGGGKSNHAQGDLSVITGGSNNTTQGLRSTIGGGNGNEAQGEYATISGGKVNRASGVSSVVAGGDFNRARGEYSVVGGGGGYSDSDSNSALGNYCVVAGGTRNRAGTDDHVGMYVSVGGGEQNVATGSWATIGGGHNNLVDGPGSTIAGGSNNEALNERTTVGGGWSNRATTYLATVSGGLYNDATGAVSTVAGGGYNKARGEHAVVCGGGGTAEADSNSAGGDYSFIGGGSGNRARGNYATISGGKDNETSGSYTTIGGGLENFAGINDATVGGGANNSATQSGSTVGGGNENKATGSNSTVPGGGSNTAAGDFSFASGFNSKANHDGAVVMSANIEGVAGDSVSSGTTEQMVLRADNGFYLTNSSGVAPAIAGRFLNTSTGAYLSNSGTWQSVSDENLKENFAPIDRAALLDKVAELEITRWNYKSEDANIQHVGPTAQEFYEMFGLGEDDKTISSLDPAGIALAAVQALYEKTKELEAASKETDSLRERVEELTRLVEELLADRKDGTRAASSARTEGR
jgi:hypothetical protein